MAIRSDRLFEALLMAGIFTEADRGSVCRFVIDAKVGDVLRLYIERINEGSQLAELLPEVLRQGELEVVNA